LITLFDLDRIFLFTLLLARVSGLVAVAPFLGERFVPVRVRALFAGTLALLLLSFSPEPPRMPVNLVDLVVLAGGELFLGVAIGFAGRLLVQAFEMAGHVIAIQMGFAMAQVFDPMQGHSGNLLGRWMWIVGMTLFLALNGHHHLLRALGESLQLAPPGSGLPVADVTEAIVRLGGDSFVTALRIGAPAIGILLLTAVALGILARTVPQMNVFVVGFPVKIAAGIAALVLSLPYLLDVARRELGELVHRLSALVMAA
jgi:flagellar biosynthetic protein FliR